MSFMTNQIIKKNKKYKIYIYIYIYIYSYLINYEYFSNLNGDRDMARTGIMAEICTSSYPSPYPIEKVGDYPYPYPYPFNAGIPRQNGNEFRQYPRERIYLPSLRVTMVTRDWTQSKNSYLFLVCNEYTTRRVHIYCIIISISIN